MSDITIKNYSMEDLEDMTEHHTIPLPKPDAYSHTQFVTCPMCEYQEQDSWELGNGEGEFEYDCQSCEAELVVTRYVEVSYTTKIKQ